MISSSRRVRRESDTIKLGKVIVWLWIGTIFLAEATSDMTFHLNSRFGKRRDASAIGFQTGSRFGRSDPVLAKLNQRLALNQAIPHRIDTRFYVVGGRWGKRSGPVDNYQNSPLKEALYSIIRESEEEEPKHQFVPYALIRSPYEDPPTEKFESNQD